MDRTEANYLTSNTFTPENPGWFWRKTDDYCDCDRCPCCGKLRRRRFNFDEPWDVTCGGKTTSKGDCNEQRY